MVGAGEVSRTWRGRATTGRLQASGQSPALFSLGTVSVSWSSRSAAILPAMGIAWPGDVTREWVAALMLKPVARRPSWPATCDSPARFSVSNS